MKNKIGITGWLYSRQILHNKTLTLLDSPSVYASHGIKTVELCPPFLTVKSPNISMSCVGLWKAKIFPSEISQLIWETWLVLILRFDELILRA